VLHLQYISFIDFYNLCLPMPADAVVLQMKMPCYHANVVTLVLSSHTSPGPPVSRRCRLLPTALAGIRATTSCQSSSSV
jgi:hypothetical protein